MVKFIEFEADEIIQNIETQSEDEYHMKKKEMILKEKMEINQLYNKKTNLINRTSATMITEKMTSAKFEILNTRDKYIKSVLADVNKELLKMRKHRLCYYQEILKKLILQAMYQVVEQEVCLILVSDDVEYVTLMIPKLKQIYLANTGINVKINIDKSIKLPTQEIGGVVVTAKDRRVLVENTLVVRLLYLTQQAIPKICIGLFGPNPTRTYLRDT
ncbi:V-type proton ATPase subunit E-like [Metopolophium dirhodum]|uniref:V-type proton ATPase subunit E-like n=1 Tax=Metopolophium dirhodum TaxID=44670 RepID=UPI00298FE595|nr:V-type proton ATPase subunit E-like [Metopolophium dirhodum]